MYYYRYLQRCPLGSFAYTIRPGDTLYVIAINNGTTVEAIMAINPGINPNNLQIGQVICVPTMVPSVPSVPPCPGGFYYTIKAGDTLYNLALQFNVTVDAIIRANPGINPNNLQIGQVICIPAAAPPTPSCSGFLYTIKAGDTLYKLAQQFNVTVSAIIAANPGIDPNRLQIGQVICIPAAAPPTPSCSGFYYTIKAGDTLYKLAQQFNVTVSAIMAANPGINPNRLQIGQVICIPRSA